jgi:predicted DNA-binding transcriptional regulator YafY
VKIERVRPAVLQVTLSAYELAAIMAAARWVAEGTEGELASEAVEQLRQVVASYDAATRQIEAD